MNEIKNKKTDRHTILYAGSYTENEKQSAIHILAFDRESGSLTMVCEDQQSENASFLSAYGETLLAVNEMTGKGCIDRYHFDPSLPGLIRTARLQVEGSALCHLHRWPASGYFSAANYMCGDFVVCRIEKNALQLVQQVRHSGIGADWKGRQEGPHVHSTLTTPDGKRLLAADLGLDQIFVYRIDPESGRVVLDREENQIKFPGGEGPRHMAFSADGRFLLAVTELGSKLFCFSVDETGKFPLVQSHTILPEGFSGKNLAADLHFSPDGRFVYASNRGADTIAAYAFDASDGRTSLVGHFPAKGRGPRNFCISPEGRYGVIANQYSGNIVVMRRDIYTGELKEKVSEILVPNVVYVGFGG